MLDSFDFFVSGLDFVPQSFQYARGGVGGAGGRGGGGGPPGVLAKC